MLLATRPAWYPAAMLRSIGFLPLALLLACSGGDSDSADAGGSSNADASSIVADASDAPDAAIADASVSVADASVTDAAIATDAGDVAPATLCPMLCDILGTCFGEIAPPSCTTECTADLQDCSADELGELDTCGANPPGDQCVDLAACIGAVGCIDQT